MKQTTVSILAILVLTGAQSPLPARSRIACAARTYYVSPAGSDSVSCDEAGNADSPKRTINDAARCLTPGDTLLLRAGTYAENLDDAIPSGMSWGRAVTVATYPEEQVVIQPLGGEYVFQSTRGSYIVLDGLILDGSNVLFDAIEITYGRGADYAHHIKLINSEVRNAPRSGVGIHQGDAAHRTDYNEFINVRVHNNGTSDFHHGFYLESSYNLLDRVEVYNNSGWGIHVYTGLADSPVCGNVIRNSQSHDNARSGKRGVGIGLYSGKGNVACGNIVRDNASGIVVNYGATETRILCNVVYNNTRGVNPSGIYNGNNTERSGTGSSAAQILNNVVYGHRRDLVDRGASSVVSGNVLGLEALSIQALPGCEDPNVCAIASDGR